MSDYAHPHALVETEWVAEHWRDPNLRLVESDEDVSLYAAGHLPGAVQLNWHLDLQDRVVRDYVSRRAFEMLMAGLGIANDTRVVFYGDQNNWWACYAFWAFTLFGHAQCAIMNGGRRKWIAEKRPLSKEMPGYPRTTYFAHARADTDIRAFRDQVLRHVSAGNPLVDVRSPQEFAGELLSIPGYPQEGASRGGHIPGARNIPWETGAREDGTFKSADELKQLYERFGLTVEKDIVTYCRIGERSSYTWFVLRYLLGYPRVRNYDGSWIEWGNLIGAPIEK